MSGLRQVLLVISLTLPTSIGIPAALASADHGWFVDLGALEFTDCAGTADVANTLEYNIEPQWDLAAGTFSGRVTALRGADRRDVGTVSGKTEPGRLSFRIVELLTIDAVAALPIGIDGKLSGVATGRTARGSAFTCGWSRVTNGLGLPLPHDGAGTSSGAGASGGANAPIGFLLVVLTVAVGLAFVGTRVVQGAVTARTAQDTERLRQQLGRAGPRLEGQVLRARLAAAAAPPVSTELDTDQVPETEQPAAVEIVPALETEAPAESIGGLGERLRDGEPGAAPGPEPPPPGEVAPAPMAERPNPWAEPARGTAAATDRQLDERTGGLGERPDPQNGPDTPKD